VQALGVDSLEDGALARACAGQVDLAAGKDKQGFSIEPYLLVGGGQHQTLSRDVQAVDGIASDHQVLLSACSRSAHHA
jgi:hypothetical protein